MFAANRTNVMEVGDIEVLKKSFAHYDIADKFQVISFRTAVLKILP